MLASGDGGQESEVNAYMVSDQCQALNRDEIFGESKGKKMSARIPTSKDDMVPSIMMGGKQATEFDPEFFIVQLGHGQPKSEQDFNILKNYDFPVENRRDPISVRTL